MLISNELFTVIESTPATFAKNKQAIFQYSLTLVETGRAPSLLFITCPGFRPQIPESGRAGTIIQIVFSDFLVDLFHYQPLAFIGGFLRRSSGCRLLLPDVLMQLVEDSIAGLRKSLGYESFEKLFQLMNRLAVADNMIDLYLRRTLGIVANFNPASTQSISSLKRSIIFHAFESEVPPLKINDLA